MKNVELFLGRTQPPHKGHKAILESMPNPVFALIKGAKSSKLKDRNPFNEQYQTKLLKKMIPDLKIVIVPSGYIPDIIKGLNEHDMNVTSIYAGSDRLPLWEEQIERVNTKKETAIKFNLNFVETQRIASATDVRFALEENNEIVFRKNMPEELWDEFEIMREIMLAN